MWKGRKIDYVGSFKIYTYNVTIEDYLYTTCYTIIKDTPIFLSKIGVLPRYYTIIEKLHKKVIFFIGKEKIVFDIDFGYLLQYNNNFYIYEVKEDEKLCKK